MLPDALKVQLQYIMPKHLLSRAVGLLAAANAGKVTTSLIELFIKQYNVDMEEAAEPDPAKYKSFNEFFTRPLKEGIRPIADGKDAFVYPVDGAISQFGEIVKDRIFQAKGHDYSLDALLGGLGTHSKHFENGQFMTIYLSPRDYHRIHMPVEGTLTDMTFVPGELFSVNPLTTENVPGLFARNERVVSLFDTPYGKMAMVLVGATIVASIETVWAGTVAPKGQQIQHTSYQENQTISLAKGEEMGRFKLGSTVVMLFEKDMLEFSEQNPGDTTRLGEQCGVLLK